MMVVDVTTEPVFRRLSPPRLLFDQPYGETIPIRSYDISPDGERFVMKTDYEFEPEPVAEIRIVQNWFEELKRLAPTNN